MVIQIVKCWLSGCPTSGTEAETAMDELTGVERRDESRDPVSHSYFELTVIAGRYVSI